MKKRLRFAVVLGMVCCTALAQAPSNLVKVTADGYSYLGEEETIKVAKERAMNDAERKAIEQGTAIYLETYSKVHNFMLIEDEIRSLAAGYLTNKKVIVDELESNPPRYHVRIEAEVKCGNLDNLLATKQTEEESQQQPLSVEFAVVAERKLADGSWGELLVRDGGELRSFDKFQIHFRPNADCYVYLLFYDAQGRASLLFPSELMGKKNFVKGDTEVRAPGRDLFYELDAATGIETVYLIASARPMADIDWLLEKMERAGSGSQYAAAIEKSIQTRGIGRISQGKKARFSLDDGKRIEQVTEVVVGKGALVRKLSFGHLP